MAQQEYNYYLTTRDNPFDPEEEKESWRLFDKLHNYDTEEKLDRWMNSTDEFMEELTEEAREEAMLRIIATDIFDIYVRVRKPVKNKDTQYE